MALYGKTAVVTGAALGIGKAMTEILLQNGAKVALLDVDETAANSSMEELNKQYRQDRTLFLRCDVTSGEQLKASFQKVIKTFGGIDILCNNAGILDETNWENTISINLMGVIRGTYLALEHMNKLTGGRGGVVINIAAMAGIFPTEMCPVYTTTKQGIVGFTRAMAAASTGLGYGIRFNALCPGTIRTQMLSNYNVGQFAPLIALNEELLERIGKLNASEVAESFLELVVDETKNGEALLIYEKEKKYLTFSSL